MSAVDRSFKYLPVDWRFAAFTLGLCAVMAGLALYSKATYFSAKPAELAPESRFAFAVFELEVPKPAPKPYREHRRRNYYGASPMPFYPPKLDGSERLLDGIYPKSDRVADPPNMKGSAYFHPRLSFSRLFARLGRTAPFFIQGMLTKLDGELPNSVVDRIIRRHKTQLDYCYRREFRKGSYRFGGVSIGFQISKIGRVSQARIVETTLDHADTENCLAKTFERIVFPRPKGGQPVDGVYRMNIDSIGCKNIFRDSRLQVVILPEKRGTLLRDLLCHELGYFYISLRNCYSRYETKSADWGGSITVSLRMGDGNALQIVQLETENEKLAPLASCFKEALNYSRFPAGRFPQELFPAYRFCINPERPDGCRLDSVPQPLVPARLKGWYFFK